MSSKKKENGLLAVRQHKTAVKKQSRVTFPEVSQLDNPAELALKHLSSSFNEVDLSEEESPDMLGSAQRQQEGNTPRSILKKSSNNVGSGLGRFQGYDHTGELPEVRTFSPVPDEEEKREMAAASAIKPSKKEMERMLKSKNKFNPEIYKFKKSDYNVQQQMFKQQFYEYGQANKAKINKQLVEVTYLEVLSRFDREKKTGDFPTEFRQNELKWAAQMMKSKKLQKIMAEYTGQVARVLNDEIGNNRQLIKDWIQYPHSHSTSPDRNHIRLQQLDASVWYPEKEAVPKSVRTAFNRQRVLLNDLQLKNRKRKEAEINRVVRAKEDVVSKVKIKEQVLARMATQRMKRQPQFEENEKPPMTPFQEAIHERLQVAKDKIDSVMDLDDNFQEELNEVTAELQKSSLEKAGKNPGRALNSLLQKWSDEPVYSQEDLDRHKGELWMSLKEFEDYLHDQEYSMELELKNAKIQYRSRVDGIRAQTSMRIEALESALIETKLSLARERERAQMQLAEMESRIFNQHMDATSDQQMERVKDLEATMEDPQFNDLPEERKVYLLTRGIKRLMTSLAAMQNERLMFTKELNELRGQVEADKDFNQQQQENSKYMNELVLYYQQSIYEMLQSTGMLQQASLESESTSLLSEEKQLALREIIELNQERVKLDQEQDRTFAEPDEKKKVKRLEKFVNQFHEVIEEVDFKSLFESYLNVVKEKQINIDNVAQEFVKLGLIDPPSAPSPTKARMPTGITSASRASGVGQTSQEDGERRSLRAPRRSMSIGPPTVPQINKKKSRTVRGQESTEDNSASYQQHVFRVDGLKLKEIRDQFQGLTKPLADGMAEKMNEIEAIQREQAERLQTESAENLGSQGNRKGPKMPQPPQKKTSRQSSIIPKETLVDRLKKNQAKRMEEQEKVFKKQHKSQLKVDKQAKQQRVGSARGGRNATTTNVQGMNPMFNSKAQAKKGTTTAVNTNTLAPPAQSEKKSSKASKNPDQLIKLKKAEVSISQFEIEDVESVNSHADTDSVSSDDLRSPDTARTRSNKSQVSRGSMSYSRSHRRLKQDSTGDVQTLKRRHSASKESQEVIIRDASKKLSQQSSNRGRIKSLSTKQTPLSKKETSSKRKKEVSGTKGISVDILKDSKGDKKASKTKLSAASPSQVKSDQESADTEPLVDHTEQALEELEQKILNKYQKELAGMVDAPESAYKLKAGINKQLVRAFRESLGAELAQREDTKLSMTGNLPEFIEVLDEIRSKYTHAENLKLMTASSLSSPTRIKRQNTTSINLDRVIPLSDCVMTEISPEGEITGFKMRPDIIKMLMWREEGQDFSKIIGAIRTVNFLNRILFSPLTDDEFVLSTRKAPPAKIVEHLSEESDQELMLDKESESQNEPSSHFVVEGSASEHQEVLGLLKAHSAAIIAKGNPSKTRYQLRMQRDQTLEELMLYKLPNVFEKLSAQEREEPELMETNHMSFQKYLEILMSSLETKLQTVLPEENRVNLSIDELVNFGLAEDLPAKPKTESKKVQTDKQANLDKPSFKHPVAESAYSIKRLNAPKPVNAEVQTDPELMESYMRTHEGPMGIKIATEHIDKTVGQEMSRTIATLNEFVSKVQLQSAMLDKDAKEPGKQPKRDATSFFESTRKSMATQISSNSPLSAIDQTYAALHNNSFTPADQLRDIRSKVQTNSDLIQDQINDYQIKKEQQAMLRKAEQAQIRQGPEKKMRAVNLNNAFASNQQQKLPRLSQAQNIQSERNYSLGTSQREAAAPLLHNSTVRAPTLIHQPFKQVHVDKKIFNQDSAQSKFSIQLQNQKGQRTMRANSSTATKNVPGLVTKGLVTKRIDFTSTKSPRDLLVNDTLVNNSFESKDLAPVRYTSRVDSKRNPSYTIEPIPSAEQKTRSTHRKTHLNTAQLHAQSVEQHPDGVSDLQVPSVQASHLRVSNPKKHSAMGYQSFLSTPHSSNNQALTTGTFDNRADLDIKDQFGDRQHILVESLSNERGDLMPRKTSTTMMMMPHSNETKHRQQQQLYER